MTTRKPLAISATCMSQFGRGHELEPSGSIGLRGVCECPAPEEADLTAELIEIYSDCLQMHNLEALPHNIHNMNRQYT